MIELDPAQDSLFVPKLRSVVDATQILDQNRKGRLFPFFQADRNDIVSLSSSFLNPLQYTVQINMSAVVQAVDLDFRFCKWSVQGGLVQHKAKILTQLFHRHGVAANGRLRKLIKHHRLFL